jgi:hypothetical protein
VSDRVSWNLPAPAFSFHLGDPGGVELMPYVGFAWQSYNNVAGYAAAFQAKLASQIWTTRSQRILLSGGLALPPYDEPGSPIGLGFGHALMPAFALGYSWTIHDMVTLTAEGSVSAYYWLPLTGPTTWRWEAAWARLGGQVDVRVDPQVSLDLRVNVTNEVHAGLGSSEGVFLGTTLAF